jgi:acyl transferase domain-containing protein/non-ribosomal peptide synthetase component F/thioesterase domain-containing protein
VSGEAERELLKDALVKIRALKAELQAVERARTEPIAIVGIGCRFPGGADTPDEYWRLLRDGVDAVDEMPDDRWHRDRYYDADPDAPGKAYVRRGGFLRDIKGFDADFFGIAPREAVRLDPQQRLLLEVSWEALEDAGIAPDSLAGRATGIYVGAMSADYAARQAHHLAPRDIDPYMLTGNDLSFAAGRLAYFLGVHGPAMVVSTACSSSLVSVHLAAQALRAGECDLALAGGVNLVLDPTTMVMLSKLRALAKDGRCKTFDASADGYGRGEGCGMIALERLSDALAGGRRVLAVIRGSAVNHDGPSAGLTVPNGRAQEALLRKAFAAASVTPEDVAYVEAHGTGTALGDPIELHALARVMGGARRAAPLLVGSVKTNIGHLEPAAGIASVIKVALALRHRQLPPHLHFTTPSPHVRWSDLPLKVVMQLEPWPAAASQRRIAGVSAFGLSGVNAHVVLEEAPHVEAAVSVPAIVSLPASEPGVGALRVLTISARTPEALEAQIARYDAFLAQQTASTPASANVVLATATQSNRSTVTLTRLAGEDATAGRSGETSGAGAVPQWDDVCFTATTGRAHFAHRLAIVARSAEEARAALPRADRRQAKTAPRVGLLFAHEAPSSASPSTSASMARELFETSSTFRRTIERCASILAALVDSAPPALELLDAASHRDAAWRIPATVAIEIAQAELWKAWGIEPVSASGAGDGEIAVAVITGACSLEAGLLTAAVRAGLVLASLETFIPAGASIGQALRSERDAGITVRIEIGRGRRAMLEALAELYARGVQIDWTAVAKDDLSGARRRVTLPTYAFQREDYWALDDDAASTEASQLAGAGADAAVATAVATASAGAPEDAEAREQDDLTRSIAESTGARRAEIVAAALAQDIKRVLGLAASSSLDTERSLLDLGLDSLMSVELRDRVRTRLGVDLELAQLLSDTSLADISGGIVDRLNLATAAATATTTTAATAAAPSSAPSLAPLSYGQRALWFIHESHPDSPAYNVGLALRVRGAVDVVALRRAFQTLVDRHASLRTVFIVDSGAPCQRILPAQEVCFEQIDAAAWTDDVLTARVKDACQRPFDLASGPLLRVALFTQSAGASGPLALAPATAGSHVLLLAMHHIACDAISCWTLLEELQIAYAAACVDASSNAGGARTSSSGARLAPALPPAGASYADFVSWQQAMVASDEGERHWQFWQRQLAGELPLLDLPTDAARPAVQTYNGASHVFTVPEPLTRALRGLARAEQATLYATLLAAFHVLLHRYTGQDDIVIGSATASRPSGFARTPGYFVNPIAIRADLSGNPAFAAFLRQVRATTLEAMEHQLFPFPLIVERLQPKRDPSRSPIFQADFSLGQPATAYRGGLTAAVSSASGTAGAGRGAAVTGAVGGAAAGAMLDLSRFELPEEEGQFDLGIHVTDEAERLTVRVKYNADLFRAGTVRTIAASFHTLLEQIVSQPQGRLNELRLLRDEERRRLIELGVGPRVEVPAICVPQMFGRQAEQTPDAVAVEMFAPDGETAGGAVDAGADADAGRAARHAAPNGPGLAAGADAGVDAGADARAASAASAASRLTYRELNRRANRLAHDLRRRGVGPDMLVGVCLPPSIDLVVALLGVLKAGGAYLPLDPAYPAERLAFMIGDAGIRTLLTTRAVEEQRLSGALEGAALSTVRLDEVAWDGAGVGAAAGVGSDAGVGIGIGDRAGVAAGAGGAATREDADDVNPSSALTPDHLAYVIYTSGSTGRPKGAMITHRGLTNYLTWALDAYRVREGCGAPVSSSIAFDATITSFFAPLLVGGAVTLLPEEGMVDALAAALRSNRPFSLVKITPAHLDVLAHLLAAAQPAHVTALPAPPGAPSTAATTESAAPVPASAALPAAPSTAATMQSAVPAARTTAIAAGEANAFVIGGEALRADTLAFWQQAAPRTRLINEYGPTETVVGCCVYEAAEPASGPVPIGRPIANTQLYVLDARMEPVPAGVIGELYIGGAGVARGYLHRPELTAERFVRDPFSTAPDARLYRTGDLARWRADGQLDYVGRADAQVKLRGFRIELGEIETVLAEHPAVADTLVLVRDSAAAGRQLIAYVVPTSTASRALTASAASAIARDSGASQASGASSVPGVSHASDAAHALDVPALRAHLAARLPDYMIPARFIALDAFPLTPNGKIDRAALPAAPAGAAPREMAAPRDTLEMTLAALWADALGVAAVGLRDNFFDLGGHSLLAVRLLARVERAFGQAVPLATILRGPTVEQMARVLRGTNRSHASALVPIQSGGSRPPFFCVPGAGGNPIYLYNLSRELGPDQPFYGLQGAGFDGETAPHTTVEAMAAYYIDAIRAVQPEGPYHLGGHSLGGWVVYEMARQLRRQGHEVPLVAIIDTPVPTAANQDARQEWDDARWIAELTDRIAKLLSPELRVSEAALRALAPDARIDAFRQALVDAGVYPAEGGAAHIRHTLDVFKAHARVAYSAPRDAGLERIVLLRTAVEPAHAPCEAGDVSWGWSSLAPTEVYMMPGDHLAVLRPPHVAALAGRLSVCLAQALQVAA